MIQFINADIWTYPADIRVITVNCVGVMGKGIAKEYRDRFAAAYPVYKDACSRNELKPGAMHMHEFTRQSCGVSHWLIATKNHWKDPSDYNWIEACLWNMRYQLRQMLTSPQRVSMPAPGCGNGGLDFRIVRKSIMALLGHLDPHNITVFNPPGFDWREVSP
jgi:O-acetyl-ADP-ribose deacetylase (regulator of RNase III)